MPRREARELLPLINPPHPAEYQNRHPRRIAMDQVRPDSCPHEQATRAARCAGCCDTNGSLTPCVIAWLKEQVTNRNVIPLHMAKERSAQRAA